MNWTMDELADRIVPAAGFDDNGLLELPCGVEGKVYQARLADDLTLQLMNPDGQGGEGAARRQGRRDQGVEETTDDLAEGIEAGRHHAKCAALRSLVRVPGPGPWRTGSATIATTP